MKNFQRKDNGFTLVELMVAMVIGLFGVLVMSTFYLTFNKDKGRTLNGASALNNSKLAMAMVESDLRNAGYGLTANGSMNCENAYGNYNGQPIDEFSIDGILIKDSTGFNGSDEIVIQYASGSNGVGGGMLRSAYTSGGSEMFPTQVFGCNVRDVILLAHGNSCSFQQVTSVNKTNFKITVQQNNEFNAPTSQLYSWPTFPIDSYATCIGGYNRLSYRVNGTGSLERATFPGDFEPVMDNVVAMKAQYGISDNPNVNKVDRWVNATGEWASTNINATKRRQIKSIRVGFMMRNTEIENSNVTQACDPATGDGLCIWHADENNPPPVVNIQTPADWQKYRYVSLSTIVPLKNMMWN